MSNILIVDDSPAIGEMIALVLKMEGHEVRIVNSKSALFDELDIYGLPDLILLDVVFGRDDGREICREIKKTNRVIKNYFIVCQWGISSRISRMPCGWSNRKAI